MNEDKKKKLRKLLDLLSTDGEKQELQKLDAQKVKDIVQVFEEREAENEANLQKLLDSFSKYASATQKHSANLTELFNGFTESLTKKLGELGGTITTSYEKNKPFNAAGVYKDMINQLSAINESVNKKPVPVWNWPQYAGVSVRDRNFSNINPATDSIGIGSFDYASLATAATTDTWTFKTNGASGNLVATVVITYTDSTKATISTVVKTPITAL